LFRFAEYLALEGPSGFLSFGEQNKLTQIFREAEQRFLLLFLEKEGQLF
jgi:hypothetical protein